MEFYITHENNDPKKDEPPLVPSQPIEKDITENTMQEELLYMFPVLNFHHI